MMLRRAPTCGPIMHFCHETKRACRRRSFVARSSTSPGRSLSSATSLLTVGPERGTIRKCVTFLIYVNGTFDVVFPRSLGAYLGSQPLFQMLNHRPSRHESVVSRGIERLDHFCSERLGSEVPSLGMAHDRSLISRERG